MLTSQKAAEALKLRTEARRSFEAFCTALSPSTYIASEHHRAMCVVMDKLLTGEIDRAIIEIPPRFGKSYHVSERLPAYFLGHHPGKHILTTSHSDPMSKRFGRKVLGIVGSKAYQSIFPGIALNPRAESAVEFETQAGGRYIATGIHGGYMGTGADLLGIDDPFKSQEEAESQTVRDSVWEAFLDLETRLEPGARMFVLHQRWHEDDLIGRIIADRINTGKEDWFRLKQPMILNECSQWEKVEKGGATDEDQAAYDAERACWPERWPLEACRKIRRRTTRRKWVSMYQQEPNNSEGDKYRRDWFNRFNLGTEPAQLNLYIVSDFAVTKDDGDWTEFYVIGIDCHGNVWFLDAWFAQADAKVWTKALVALIKQWKPNAFFGEAGQIRRAIEPFLNDLIDKERAYTVLEWLPSSADKLARARASIGMCSMQKWYVPNTSWGDRLVDQHCAFPTSKMDHSVDATSQIGRALDIADGPSRLSAPSEERLRRRDSWERARERAYDSENQWKVA